MLLDPAYQQSGRGQGQQLRQKQWRPRPIQPSALAAATAVASSPRKMVAVLESRPEPPSRRGPRSSQGASSKPQKERFLLKKLSPSRDERGGEVRPDPPAVSPASQRRWHARKEHSSQPRLPSKLSNHDSNTHRPKHLSRKDPPPRKKDHQPRQEQVRSESSGGVRPEKKETQTKGLSHLRHQPTKLVESSSPQMTGRRNQAQELDEPNARQRGQPLGRYRAKSSSFQSHPWQLLQVYKDLEREELLDDLAKIYTSVLASGAAGGSSMDNDDSSADACDDNGLPALGENEIIFQHDEMCQDRKNASSTITEKMLSPEIIHDRKAVFCRSESTEDVCTLATAASTASTATEKLTSSSEIDEFNSTVHLDNGGLREPPTFCIDNVLLQKQIKYLECEPTPLDDLPPPTSMQQLVFFQQGRQPLPNDIIEETLRLIRERWEFTHARNS